MNPRLPLILVAEPQCLYGAAAPASHSLPFLGPGRDPSPLPFALRRQPPPHFPMYRSWDHGARWIGASPSVLKQGGGWLRPVPRGWA